MERKIQAISGIILVLALCLALQPSFFAQEKRTMNFVDVINLKRVSELRLSPDGKQLIFNITQADWEKNKWISHIWRMNVDGSELTQMTNGEEGEGSGVWSPDGKYIGFVAKRNAESQIYLLNTKGGEAIELTKHKGGVVTFSWSPDSQKIYFIASEPKSEEEEKREKNKDDAYSFEKNYKHQHLWVMEIDTREEKRLTEGEFTVKYFSLSRDGTKILYLASPTPLFDDLLEAELWLIDFKDGSKRRLTENKIWEQNAEISPDNKLILFLAEANERLEEYYQSNIFLLPAEGGAPRATLPDFKYEISEATWSVDGNSIYFVANMGVHSEIFALDLKEMKVRGLSEGNHAISDFHYLPDIDTAAYFENTPFSPAILWISGMRDFSPRMVCDLYPELKEFKLAEYEVVSWKGRDGEKVEGILIYPVCYEKGKKYPLLVHTHGGPAASDKLTFDGYAHARAGRGYAILKPNYRGSTGYGNDFLRDMVGHYFHNADDDVLCGVDYLVEKQIADPEKLGTLGWSAGGHMTNWLITQTDRFKAASSGAGASNWISMYAQSDVRIYRTPWFKGDPWDEDSPLSNYRENSPIFHIYKAKTPTLLLFGEEDRRVPLPQGIEIYRALKARNVPTELIIFPREGHGLNEIRHALYKMNKEFAWFEKYLMGREFKFDELPEKKEQ